MAGMLGVPASLAIAVVHLPTRHGEVSSIPIGIRTQVTPLKRTAWTASRDAMC